MRITVAFFLLTPILHAGDAASDLKLMEGTWKVVVMEADGKPAPEKEKGFPLKLVVKGDQFSSLYADKVLMQGTLKLAGDKGPREIDAELKMDPFKGMVQKGLYEIKGDEMRVIFAEPGKARPSDFKTRDGQMLLHYFRLKDAKKK